MAHLSGMLKIAKKLPETTKNCCLYKITKIFAYNGSFICNAKNCLKLPETTKNCCLYKITKSFYLKWLKLYGMLKIVKITRNYLELLFV